MTVPLVCDASAIVAALLDSGRDGRWATERITDTGVCAPTLLPFECANVIRRLEQTGTVAADQAVQAHADLVDLAIEYWPYDVLAMRIWELRANLTSYDATYVALAELLQTPLITLDRRIQRAPGLRCDVVCP
ncbi:type II toxin-antitoxin system VapC family toxin [Mycobacterium hubeiense]|uniref:type II toxin-antitoxin system VapC family toxin n=1 Tax=Mycobacterium hubeiense TaxID=1867256 RepID=UPI000C7EBA22|nr:type II toxin-antitoxin system VapC family toxin [Mycobacterium sp. QGD 101]